MVGLKVVVTMAVSGCRRSAAPSRRPSVQETEYVPAFRTRRVTRQSSREPRVRVVADCLITPAPVVVTRVVIDPERHREGGPTSEVVLTIGWGAVNRIDLEPASCGDPQCEADHGYTGTASNDDFSLRVAEVADGASTVAQVLQFAAALSEATASRSR